jgi:hypothetical protein
MSRTAAPITSPSSASNAASKTRTTTPRGRRKAAPLTARPVTVAASRLPRLPVPSAHTRAPAPPPPTTGSGSATTPADEPSCLRLGRLPRVARQVARRIGRRRHVRHHVTGVHAVTPGKDLRSSVAVRVRLAPPRVRRARLLQALHGAQLVARLHRREVALVRERAHHAEHLPQLVAAERDQQHEAGLAGAPRPQLRVRRQEVRRLERRTAGLR